MQSLRKHLANHRWMFTAMLCAVVVVSACRQPIEPEEELEEVLPNAVMLTLTEQGSTNRITATWRKTGEQANAAITVDTLRLGAGKTYTGTITAKNDLKTPAEDLTEEYKKFADEHQFFYTVSGAASNRVTFTITDKDSKDLPLGLEYTVVVTGIGAATGALNVVLGHFDDVKKDGTTRSPESDVDINFPVAVR